MTRVIDDMRVYLELLHDIFPGKAYLTRDEVCEYLGLDWYTLTKDKAFKYKQPSGKRGTITVPMLMFARYLAA